MSRLDVDFHPIYADLFRPFRYKIYFGGRGGGKSWAVARALLILGVQRKIRILCAREIQHSISDSVHKLLTEQIDALGLMGFYNITQQAITGANGTEFIFKGLHFNYREIKSTEGIDYCWVEEAQSVSEDSWATLIPTVRKADSEIWLTFNPLNESDPTYQKFVVNTPPNSALHKVSWRENPYFPEVLRAEKDYLERVDRDAYLHIWEGEVRHISNAVIFKGKYEVEDFVTPEGVRYYQGADWGFATDPTALVRCYIQGKKLYIDAEAYGVGVELDETAALFDSIPTARTFPIKADSARPETISYMRRQGFNISAAKKWHGSVEDGIAFLKSFEKIIVHPRCKHTIDELDHYSYKVDKQTNDILPIIVDANNHCLVRGTLVKTRQGDKPIEEITTADEVLTRKGYRRVEWSGLTDRNRHVLTITTASGETITATGDHRIFTIQRGFVRADKLTDTDEVIICKAYALKPTAESGADTPRQKDGATANISKADANIYIILFGSCITGADVKATLFIIKTAIAKITTSLISKKSHRKNTAQTVINSPKNAGRKQDKTFWHSKRKQKNGTQATKGANGTDSTRKNVTSGILTSLKSAVLSAARFLSRKHITINSAPMLVKANGAESQALTTLQERVHSAAENFLQANTAALCFVQSRVQCVTDGGNAPEVYDITVAEEHEFFANNILVHNCCDSLRYALDGLIQGKTPMHINPNAIKRSPFRR